MGNIESAIELAVQHLRSSRLSEAETLFGQVLAVRPAQPDALHGLSVIAFQRGEKAQAAQLLRRLIEAHPARVSARYDLACMLIEQGQDDEALLALEGVLAVAPQHAHAWYQRGFLMKLRGDLDKAQEALDRCLQLMPGHPSATNEMARLYRDRGDYPAALAAFERAEGAGERSSPALYQAWWQFLSISALPSYGLPMLRRGLRQSPQDAELHIGLAQALENDGDRAGALAAYRHALALDRNRGAAIGSLLELLAGDAEPSLLAAAEAMLSDTAARAPAKALIGYGLGKVYQAKQQYDAAFRAWQTANEARREEAGRLDPTLLLRQVEDTLAAFPAVEMRRLAEYGSPDARPVFVVGMPRSGTTLVEQIISAHPDAEGLGELPDLPIVSEAFCRKHGNASAWPRCADIQGGEMLRDAAAQYLRALAFRSRRPALRLIDKAPLNFFNVGLAAILFPQARFVWCRRDPRDVCTSIYSENFAPSQKYATDLGHLALYHRQQDRLMSAWIDRLPGRIHTVAYEAMVGEQESQTRALIEFMGLEWDERCLQFHKSERSVQTPSRWQVRQPMYRSSLARWRRYEPWLGPLLDEFGTDAAPR